MTFWPLGLSGSSASSHVGHRGPGGRSTWSSHGSEFREADTFAS